MSKSQQQPQLQQQHANQNAQSQRGRYGHDVLNLLSQPFTDDEIEWKVQTVTSANNGKFKALIVPYVEARAIQNRLDEVCGINWSESYREFEIGGKLAVECTISIYFPDTKQTVIRKDAAELTNIEAIKGGYSDAQKRAAVKFTIGRFLYNLPQQWVEIISERPRGKHEYVNGKYKVNRQETWVTGYYLRPSVSDILNKSQQSPQNPAPQQQRGQQSKNQRQQGSQQPQNYPTNSNGPTEAEYMNAVKNVESVVNFLGLQNDIPQVFTMCKVRVFNALNQASFADLQRVFFAINPVKLLLERGYTLKLNNEQIYAYAAHYLGGPVGHFNQLVGRLSNDDVQRILTKMQEDIRNYQGNHQRHA